MDGLELPAKDAASASRLRQTSVLIVLGFLIGQFCLKIATELPLKFVLKDHLHLPAQSMAVFFALSAIAWYCKPLAGLLSDSVPLFGSRRRSYLLIGTLLAVIACICLGTVPREYTYLLLAVIILNTMLMIMSTVFGGLLVEIGQETRATGRLSMMRNVAFISGTLFGSAVGGLFATRPFIQACALSAMLLSLLLPAILILTRNTERSSQASSRKETAMRFREQWLALRTSRGLWLVVVFQFFLYIAPGYATPLFYYQTNSNHFTAAFIGWLGVASSVAGIVGSLIYGSLCKRLPLRTWLIISIIASALASLGYLHYHTERDAWVVEILQGITDGLAIVLVYDMAARVAPRGSEALSYALIMAVHNISVQVSDVIGSYMNGALHITFERLVPINAATTLLMLILLPFLPAALLARRDGDHEEAAPT